ATGDRRPAERDVDRDDQLVDGHHAIGVAIAGAGGARDGGRRRRRYRRRRRRWDVTDGDHQRGQVGAVAVDGGRRVDAVAGAEQPVQAGRAGRLPHELPRRLAVGVVVLRAGVRQLAVVESLLLSADDRERAAAGGDIEPSLNLHLWILRLHDEAIGGLR